MPALLPVARPVAGGHRRGVSADGPCRWTLLLPHVPPGAGGAGPRVRGWLGGEGKGVLSESVVRWVLAAVVSHTSDQLSCLSRIDSHFIRPQVLSAGLAGLCQRPVFCAESDRAQLWKRTEGVSGEGYVLNLLQTILMSKLGLSCSMFLF